MRGVAQLGCLRDDLDADALQETEALVADGDSFDAVAFGFQLARFLRDLAQHVGVHAAAQTFVGGDDDETDGLRAHVRGDHERVRVLRVCTGKIGGDVTNLLTVRTGRAHPVLRLAHLGRGDHFHRLGDLLRILYALDLATYLFACCHECFLFGPPRALHQRGGPDVT